MGSAPSIPQVNTGALDATQQQYNIQAGAASQAGSNVNQVTPYGNLTYTQTGTGPGGVPTYTATTQLSPMEQAIFGGQQQIGVNAANQANTALSSFNPHNPAGQIGNMTSGLTGQQMSDYMASVAPYQKQALASEQATLANQGLTPGNHAYDLAMQNFVQGQNQANLGAAAQFEPQAFQQATSLYGMPLSIAQEEAGLVNPGSLSQNLINTPTASYSPVNAIGAQSVANQAAIQQAQLQEQQYGSMLGGLFGLGTAGIKALPYL